MIEHVEAAGFNLPTIDSSSAVSSRDPNYTEVRR